MPELRRKPPDSWRRGSRPPRRAVGLACQPQRILGHPAPHQGCTLPLASLRDGQGQGGLPVADRSAAEEAALVGGDFVGEAGVVVVVAGV
jgi:hypothetical protein